MSFNPKKSLNGWVEELMSENPHAFNKTRKKRTFLQSHIIHYSKAQELSKNVFVRGYELYFFLILKNSAFVHKRVSEWVSEREREREKERVQRADSFPLFFFPFFLMQNEWLGCSDLNSHSHPACQICNIPI
jgi:hypothetical protein